MKTRDEIRKLSHDYWESLEEADKPICSSDDYLFRLESLCRVALIVGYDTAKQTAGCGGAVAIRIRKINDKIVALCAAESEPEDGDIYLDDSIDHALRMKFIKDYESEGVDFKRR